jgi:hypothetical protein
VELAFMAVAYAFFGTNGNEKKKRSSEEFN